MKRPSDFHKVISFGDDYLRAYSDFRNDPEAYQSIEGSSLQKNTAYWEQYIRLCLAEAYCRIGQAKRGLVLLERVDWTLLDARRTSYFVGLLKIMAGEGIDVGSLLNACWEGIQKPVPSAGQASERIRAFREQVSVEDARPMQEETQNDTQIPAELLQLAEKLKAVLERFPPDDPAVIELKNSDTYQKIAWLIER